MRNRELIPADLVLLESSDPNGLCFVMTANLDGETNLKLRQVSTDMQKKKGYQKGCKLRCELPNNRLNHFEGTFTDASTEGSFALSNSNLLLRGTQLRNTHAVKGLVVFVGRESKIQMNANKSPLKMSSLTHLSNYETLCILLVQCSVCLLCGILAAIYVAQSDVKSMDYLWRTDDLNNPSEPEEAGEALYLKFFSYILVFTNFIPIAHVVCLDMCKLIQSTMMTYDLECYHEIRDVYGDVKQFPLEARSSELNEELGMVEYVFSDKTGTLTCNVMEFRKCSIDGISYGLGTTEIGRAYRARNNLPIPMEPERLANELQTPYVNFVDPAITAVLYNQDHPKLQGVHEFFLSLALNHEVMPEHSNGEIILSASNPDEAALVYAAQHCNRTFHKRVRSTSEEVTVKIEGRDVTFELLHNLEFSSVRKRSSVVVRMNDGEIMLFTKGADNIILPLLSTDADVNDPQLVEETNRHLLEYVNDGLRTLLVAQAEIPKAKYEAWAMKMHEADIALEQRQEAREKAMAEIERDLKLMGATAIEDKLQGGVGGAISSLRQGGVKVWMLTGDKVGTAVNIGFSCELITKDMLALRFVGDEEGQPSEIEGRPVLPGLKQLSKASSGEQIEMIKTHLKRLHEERLTVLEFDKTREACLIVDTEALSVLESGMQEDEELGRTFMKISELVKSVICARVSPKQKARIVKMVRDASPGTVTLSIGDGANDVPMIQCAHIGIGIYGLEGRQAVNASDYAIGQFRFLNTLLLVHGRWNYRRCALLTNYLFYKNAVLVLPNFFLGFYALMSGHMFYYDTFYQFFNTFFTSLPILYVATLDQDVTSSVAIRYPQIYRDGIDNIFITHKIFWRWMSEGILSGAVAFFIPLAAFGKMNIAESGKVLGYYDFGMFVFAVVVIIVQFRLGLEICYWTGIEVTCFTISLGPGLWFLWYIFSSQPNLDLPALVSSYQIYGSYEMMTGEWSCWCTVILSTVVSISPVLVFLVSASDIFYRSVPAMLVSRASSYNLRLWRFQIGCENLRLSYTIRHRARNQQGLGRWCTRVKCDT